MDQVHAGIEPEDPDLNEVLDQCYAGKSPQELMSDVVSFAEKVQVEGFTGMTFSESFYKPMVEVIKYLRANDFDVFVVTACERYVSRALAVEFVDFAPDHVIGMDMPVVATGQGDELGVDYTFALDDEVLLAGTREREDGVKKSNKVFAIISQIGVRPILAFGNSSGDFAMLNYAASNPDHQGLGFLVIADDAVREYGNDEKAQEMRDTVAAQGWVGISMRDDWQTIYGEGVERTSLPTYEESAS
jgi:phosphoserine phosphatase